MPKLTDSEQRALIGGRLSKTLSTTDAALRGDREKAMDFYYGRPLGNEQEGRAQIVSKDMMDTIEWIMPSLMRVFCTMNAVQFDPVGPEDEEEAKEETLYVRHVLWKKNPGFMLIYNWLKDGLMQKVGYVKYWWEEENKLKYDEYTGLTDEQLMLTMQSLEERGEVEVIGQEKDETGWNIKLRIKEKYGCAKIDCFPPEEIIVDAACRGDVKKAKFVGHLRKNVSRSELIEEGFTEKQVRELTSYDWSQDLAEEMARDTVNESIDTDETFDYDWASQELQLLDCHTYIDVDGDGIAELRHYLLSGDEILTNEEAPEIPYESWTPIPVPHRHAGLSIYDIMEDLQRVKTALQRGLLDNVYFTNAPRMIYSRDVDVESLQINRPGGHVLVNVSGPSAGYINPMPVNPIAGSLLPVIDYFDSVRETRTGVGPGQMGVDADVLAQSTKGAYMDAKSTANQRIEAIARIFAETGYSSLFSSIHRLLMRHQDWSTRAKLADKWVMVNPTEWQERANLTVSVGLGNASKDEVRQNLGLMGQAQQQAAQMPGLIQAKNVFSLFRRMQTELGFENDAFITDPASPEYKQFMDSQQQGEDPIVTAEKVKQDGQLKGKQFDGKAKAADILLQNKKLDNDMALGIAKLEVEGHIDLAKTGIGAELKQQDIAQRGRAQAQVGNGAAAAGQPDAAGGFPGGAAGPAAANEGMPPQ